jgi:hypothetical protein
MTMPLEPGERRPTDGPDRPDRPQLDRPPGDRYGSSRDAALTPGRFERVQAPLAVAIGGVVAFVLLGGVLAVTAGLIVVAGAIGWLTGLLVRPPLRAAAIAVGIVVLGLLGVWLFGRWEGGVLDPIDYLAEVEGFVVPIELLAAGALAAAASR